MRSPWRMISWRSVRQRACAVVTLIAYMLAALGAPLPAAARKADDLPFPCQNHPCGCRTAEQCWAGCCCFTPEERWAWAHTHHVEPPAYAERPTAHSWRTARLRDTAQGRTEVAKSCRHCAAQDPISSAADRKPRPCRVVEQPQCTDCRQPQAPSKNDHAPPRNCQTARTQPSCHQTPTPASAKGKTASKGTLRWGFGVTALRCQGQSTLWAITGAALPPAPPLTWSPCLPLAGWLSASTESPLILPSVPLEPPPRTVRV